jgi:hypothetical protein
MIALAFAKAIQGTLASMLRLIFEHHDALHTGAKTYGMPSEAAHEKRESVFTINT